MRNVTPAFDARLVAVGSCQTDEGPVGVAWDTQTGSEWRRILETDPGFTLSDASSDGAGGSILVGNGEEEFVPRVWKGNAESGYEAFDLPLSTEEGLAESIARREGTVLVVGAEYPNGIEGPREAAAWLWREPFDSEVEPLAVPSDAAWFFDVLANDSGFIVAGLTHAGTFAVWRWVRDRGWSDTEPLPGGEALQNGELRQVVDQETILGTRAVWTRGQGGWTEFPFEEGLEVLTAVRVADGLIGAGLRRDPDGAATALVLTSADESEWTERPYAAADDTPIIRALAALNDIVVGVGDAAFVGPGSVAAYGP